jgi:hypothetical protein
MLTEVELVNGSKVIRQAGAKEWEMSFNSGTLGATDN